MTEHHFIDFSKPYFQQLMELIDGKPKGSVDGKVKRETLGDGYLGALQVMTAENHAYHAGIITEDADGVLHFDREKLDEILANGYTPGRGYTAPCVFDCGKG